jgi:2,3-dihydroxyphenylpropionate 1,2-dioxygenase
MAEIVAAAAAVHAPQLLSRPPHENLAKLDASTDALRAFGKVLDETGPDAVILIGLDHLETFWLEAVPTFTLVVSQEADMRYMGRQKRLPVATDLAVGLLKGLIRRDFDLTYSQEAVLGHAFLTPAQYILEDRRIPIVPLLVNCYLPPLPSPRRCYALGQAMAEVLAERHERVAVIASGGMSHYPGTSKYFAPNVTFDEWIIEETRVGRYERLLGMTPEQLDEVGENELLTWFVLLGMLGGTPGSLLTYQATSHHGHGVLQFVPPIEPPVRDSAPPPAPYGGHEPTAGDYVYYRFPEPSSFALNKLLHTLIEDAGTRAAFVRDRAAVIGRAGLSETEMCALYGDGFTDLVDLGAHPLLALSARQVVEIEARAQKEPVPERSALGGPRIQGHRDEEGVR